jgi:hypothetical protein
MTEAPSSPVEQQTTARDPSAITAGGAAPGSSVERSTGVVPPRRPRAWAQVRNALPWLVTLVLLAWLLVPYANPTRRIELVRAFSRARWWGAPVAIAGALFAYFADTFATSCVLAWHRVELRMREVAIMRGVTYFLGMINYGLGQAAMVYVLARHGVRAARATGIMLFVMGLNVLVLLTLAGISIAVGADAPRTLVRGVELMLFGVPLYFVVLLVRPRLLTERELLAPIVDLGFSGCFKGMLVRLPHVLGMMLAHFTVMRCFDIAVPPMTAALYLPIVFAVAVLPITAQGIGAVQMLSIQFFGRFAHGAPESQSAAVLAYSLFMIALWLPTQMVIAVVCLRTQFGRALSRATRAPAPPSASPS